MVYTVLKEAASLTGCFRKYKDLLIDSQPQSTYDFAAVNHGDYADAQIKHQAY